MCIIADFKLLSNNVIQRFFLVCRKVVITVDTSDLVFPGVSIMSFYMKEFVERLLERNPRQRLGFNGVEGVKQHPLFATEVRKSSVF